MKENKTKPFPPEEGSAPETKSPEKNVSKSAGHHGPVMTLLKNILRVVIPLGISAGLVIWMFYKLDFRQIGGIISRDCSFFWICMMMFITMLSHIVRGIRWGIQLRAAGVPRMPVVAESVPIFSAYALNLIVPYLGEAFRCVYVARREKVKLSTVVGTDLGDRGSDAIVVVMLLGLALIVAHPALIRFFDQYPVGRAIEHILSRWELWTGLGAALLLFLGADFRWRSSRFFSGINLSLSRMWQGFRVLFYMKGRWAYVFLTIGIWTCYFMETYCCFFAFPFTRELVHTPGSAFGLIPGLVVFVFGSFSMAVPSNGGLGPWNVAVMYALMLYGVGHTEAAAYSIVAWGFQAMMLIALGIFSAFYITVTDRRRQSSPAAAGTAGH